jgi:hypothetical protein
LAAGRIPRLSTTLRRTLDAIGVRPGTALHRVVNATIRSLKNDTLPGAGDYTTAFAPGHAYVRRVSGQNIWLLYRFDEEHVTVMTARNQPPIPFDE